MSSSKSTVAIVGLGLIGGSIALALRQTGRYALLGIDTDPAVLTAARDKGAVDEVGGPELLKQADLLILALAPHTAEDFLRQNRDLLRPGTIVTDVSGVKRAVVAALTPLCREAGLEFIGGHPMAGKEKNGFGNADAAIFKGASYILTPTADTSQKTLDTLTDLAKDLGCTRVTITSPEQHDRMIAFTSQLPHVLAGAYVKSPSCPHHAGFSAGSYRDVSRVATVDETLWSELFLLNADTLCAEIDILVKNLIACREAISSGDRPRLSSILREGREIKENEGKFES